MTWASLRLEARDPARGLFRSYRVEARPDLFGLWVEEVSYGRAGARGRQARYGAATEEEAPRVVKRCLARRASAPRRIGVAYEVWKVAGDPTWLAWPPQVAQGGARPVTDEEAKASRHEGNPAGQPAGRPATRRE